MSHNKRAVKTVAVLSGFLVLFTFLGCGKRRNVVSSSSVAAGALQLSVHEFPSLKNNPLEAGNPPTDSRARRVIVYTPPGYRPVGFGPPFPVLYLLHQFDGNENSFGMYQLARVMDELIAAGEIQPMLVVQTDASTIYGGSFYTNSTGTGNYADMIVKNLIDYIERDPIARYNVFGGRRSRAIGGHGMGGYGALRLALENDSLFSSVSCMSAPLAFDGTGGDFKGFIDRLRFVDTMFAENGLLTGGQILVSGRAVVDTAEAFRRYKNLLRPDPGKPLTRLFFAMAAALSPTQQGDKDSLKFKLTLKQADPGMTLPINFLGKVEQPIFDRWVAKDVHTMVKNNPNKLDSLPVYVDAGNQDDFQFNLQSEAFNETVQLLKQAHPFYDYVFEEYAGYPGVPANHTNFISDRLRQVLKFHSDRMLGPPKN